MSNASGTYVPHLGSRASGMWDQAGPFLLAAVPLLLFAGYQALVYWRFKQYGYLAQLKPSLVWGHMKALNEFMVRGDRKRDIDMVFSEVYHSLGKPPIVLFDFRPVAYPMAVITNHEVAEQVSRTSGAFPWSLPKSPTLGEMKPLVGKHSILTLGGEEWKSLRKRFNAGFSPQHLMTLLPCMLDKTQFFLKHLDDYCESGEGFRLDTILVNLTFDIIGKVTMDVDFGAQETKERKGELITLYGDLLDTFNQNTSMIPLVNPLIRLKRRSLAKRIDALLKRIVQTKFAELKARESGTAASTSGTDSNRNLTSLSLQGLDELDDATADDTVDQLKTFLLAGHDTTSILLQWCFYELSRSPRIRDRLVAELDAVFGPDTDPDSVRRQLLESGGEQLKRMSYTSAVIKELLRMYAPAGTARMPPPGTGFTVRLPDGKEVCLDGLVVYNCANIIQRDQAVYGEWADLFIPERWLSSTDPAVASGELGDKVKTSVPASAWRPFERGPRNCIGQEMANIEARVILACCMRRYDFVKVGLGELDLDEQGLPVLNEKGQYKVKSEMYSTRQVTPKPIDGTRVKVRLSERAKQEAGNR